MLSLSHVYCKTGSYTAKFFCVRAIMAVLIILALVSSILPMSKIYKVSAIFTGASLKEKSNTQTSKSTLSLNIDAQNTLRPEFPAVLRLNGLSSTNQSSLKTTLLARAKLNTQNTNRLSSQRTTSPLVQTNGRIHSCALNRVLRLNLANGAAVISKAPDDAQTVASFCSTGSRAGFLVLPTLSTVMRA